MRVNFHLKNNAFKSLITILLIIFTKYIRPRHELGS